MTSAMLVNKHKLSDSVACLQFSAHTLLIYSFINVRSVQWQTNILEDIKSVIIFIYLTVTAYEFKQRVSQELKTIHNTRNLFTESEILYNIEARLIFWISLLWIFYNLASSWFVNDRIGFIFSKCILKEH